MKAVSIPSIIVERPEVICGAKFEPKAGHKFVLW